MNRSVRKVRKREEIGEIRVWARRLGLTWAVDRVTIAPLWWIDLLQMVGDSGCGISCGVSFEREMMDVENGDLICSDECSSKEDR